MNALTAELPARERVTRSSWGCFSSRSLMPGRWWRRCALLHPQAKKVAPGILSLPDAPQIREQNPKLAKQTQVLKVTVDKASAAHCPFLLRLLGYLHPQLTPSCASCAGL